MAIFQIIFRRLGGSLEVKKRLAASLGGSIVLLLLLDCLVLLLDVNEEATC